MYTDWSDEVLADHLNQILAEQERRQRLATIPATIQQLAAQYVDGGGDPANLTLSPTDAPQNVHDEASQDEASQAPEPLDPAGV